MRDVKVDTSTNRDIVFVATDSGLYRSADDGQTYSAVQPSPPAVEHRATSAGWLARRSRARGRRRRPVRAGDDALLSTDLGATWAPITNAGNVFALNGRTTLGVAVPGDSVVYAYSSTVGDTAMRDVYRSADGGQTWVANGVNSTKVPTNPVTGASVMGDMNICHAQCWYNQMVLVDPQDATRNTVWIGGDLATARTTNGGGSWTIKTWWLYNQDPTLPYAHADHHAAAFKTTGTPTVILGNDGGLNISEDNGTSFSSDKNNGLVTNLFYSVAGNPLFPNLVIGGTQDDGSGSAPTTDHLQPGSAATAWAPPTARLTPTRCSAATGLFDAREPQQYATRGLPEPVAATANLSDVGFGFIASSPPRRA